MERYDLQYLDQLEAEAIHIFREAVATVKNPVLFYSIGKDSSVLLKLAQKAFAPAPIPFPLLHVDTKFEFPEMAQFRDYYVQKIGAQCIVKINEDPIAQAMTAKETHTERYVYYKKTCALLEAMQENNFDAGFGGARRDEEKSRAKERIFSHRNEQSTWDPKNQRPELWNLYNTQKHPKESFRIFPISNWTERDVWEYIQREKIELVPLYFSKKQQVVKRDGIILRVDQWTVPQPDEKVITGMYRYRTLGCAPSTGLIPSQANTVEAIIKELSETEYSERQNRAIDKHSQSSMEKKKKEGHF